MKDIANRINDIEELVNRFTGINMMARRVVSKAWPMKWRVQMIVSAKKHDNFKITAYGHTMLSAMQELQEQIDRQNKEEMLHLLAYVNNKPGGR